MENSGIKPIVCMPHLAELSPILSILGPPSYISGAQQQYWFYVVWQLRAIVENASLTFKA